MSKLKNAPLLEVIFELRWNMADSSHWERYPYLHGDLYSQLKNKYPQRELLVPGEVPQEVMINKPVYRFKSQNGYPLFQVGPGLITLNTTDDFYEWDDYFAQIKELSNEFFQLYNFGPNEKVSPSLSYYDFLKLDLEEQDVLGYLSENLNIKITQNFHEFNEDPNSFNLGIGYKTNLGNFNLRIDAGINKNQEKGLILQFQLNGLQKQPNIEDLTSWLNDGHKLCSKLFKQLTEGNLFNSFTK
jgi:uncharacterized protein (TIGR04255 family)